MSRLDLRDPAFVARSAPSGPILTVTSGLIARWEADSIVGLNDDDPIATWPDTSGSSRDATQGTAANKPLFKTNIFGTKPGVRFDGSNDKLSFTPSSLTDLTVFLVMNVRTFRAFAGPLSWREASTAGFHLWDMVGNSSAMIIGLGKTNSSNAVTLNKAKSATNYNFPDTAGSGFPTANGIAMWRYTASGPTIEAKKNSQVIASAATDPGFSGDLTDACIGRSGSAGFDFLNCDIGAVLVYDSALSDGDCGSVFTYLNSKFVVY